jgi:hypothetical protein
VCEEGPPVSRLSELAGPRRGGSTTDQNATEARLADASSRIDEIASRARGAREDTRIRVEQRVDALRTRQAWARSRPHTAVKAEARPDDTSAYLDRELAEMDIEIAIAEAQLALDLAEDHAAFEPAVTREINAYRAYADLLDERTVSDPQSTPMRGSAAAEAIRVATAAAVERLRRYRDLTNEVSDSLRAGILTALDDLERSAARARSTDDE